MSFLANPVKIILDEVVIRMNDHDVIDRYILALKQLFPHEITALNRISEQMKRVSGYMDVIYGIDNPLFLDNFRDLNYLRKTLLPWLISYQSKIKKAEKMKTPIYEYLRQFTKNDTLVDLIAQHFFKDTPAFFALSYFKLYQDYIYPQGGTKALVEALQQAIESNQGTILLDLEVDKLEVEKHECRLSDGQSISYRKLIWAADQTRLYALAAHSNPKGFQSPYEKRLVNHGGDSVLTVFLGTTIPKEKWQESFGPHAFFTPKIEGISMLPDWGSLDDTTPEPRLAWFVDYLKKTTYEVSIPVL